MKIGKCRRCEARVIMAKYTKPPYRKAPIEVDPSPDGNIALSGERYEIIPEDLRPAYIARGVPLHKSHFATCAFARTFAKKAKARRDLKTERATAATVGEGAGFLPFHDV
ncbi:MAG: hypothetical protein V7638_3806 [Acidobacteriota bacterium]|jgi:hypothetical protein